jgi:hypothetical protein
MELRASGCAPLLFASIVSAQTSTGALSEEELRKIQEAFGAPKEETSPEAKREASEDGWAERAVSAVTDALNLELAVILDVALAYFSNEPLQLGGHDPGRTGFTFQGLELSIGGSIDPFLRFDSNIVFAPFGVEVEEAYVTSLALPWGLQVRAGQFLTRFGRINAMHPHAWHFADQALPIGKMLGSEGNRGLGLELSWLTPLPWFVELVASANDAAGECCARSFFGADDPGIRGLDDFLYTLALEQFFPFDEDWSLYFGLSTQLGPNSTGNDNRTEIYGTDLYLRWRPVASTTREALSLQIEGLLRARQIPRDSLVDWGMYAQLVYEFALRWEVGARFEAVSGVEGDPLDPEWTELRTRTAVQATFYPSHFSRVRLQGSWDHPTYLEEDVFSVFLNLEVLAGAHGAHEY